MRPAEFEELLRLEAARELVAGGVQAAATMPATAARTVLDFLGEKRGFDWLRLDAGLLPAPIAAPTDAELEAEHEAHPRPLHPPRDPPHHLRERHPRGARRHHRGPRGRAARRLRGRRRHLPDPERRVADRIGFGTAAEAAAAKARLDAGEIDFDALAAERGLKPEDIDQGFVTADELAAEARDAVFGAPEPGHRRPGRDPARPVALPHQRHPRRRDHAVRGGAGRPRRRARARRGRAADPRGHRADRGPARRRRHRRGDRRRDRARARQRRARRQHQGGLADDPAFREAALAAETGVETDLVALDDGGLATLRVDAVEPPALLPLAEVRDRVAADWTAARTAEALTELAEGYVAELEGGLALAALAERLGRPVAAVPPLTRGETAEALPRRSSPRSSPPSPAAPWCCATATA